MEIEVKEMKELMTTNNLPITREQLPELFLDFYFSPVGTKIENGKRVKITPIIDRLKSYISYYNLTYSKNVFVNAKKQLKNYEDKRKGVLRRMKRYEKNKLKNKFELRSIKDSTAYINNKIRTWKSELKTTSTDYSNRIIVSDSWKRLSRIYWSYDFVKSSYRGELTNQSQKSGKLVDWNNKTFYSFDDLISVLIELKIPFHKYIIIKDFEEINNLLLEYCNFGSELVDNFGFRIVSVSEKASSLFENYLIANDDILSKEHKETLNFFRNLFVFMFESIDFSDRRTYDEKMTAYVNQLWKTCNKLLTNRLKGGWKNGKNVKDC